jgi:two-component system OmpR family sensor kinase
MEGDLAELEELVNELLSMSKLDNAQEPQRVLFELEPLLRESADGLHPRPQRLALELGSCLGSIDGDRRLIGARSATCCAMPRNTRPARWRCTPAATASGSRSRSRTTAPAFRTSERERIFEPFFRLDRSRDRATGGFGLGLSIARKAVALHGGTLVVERAPMGGARFVISLPDGVVPA